MRTFYGKCVVFVFVDSVGENNAWFRAFSSNHFYFWFVVDNGVKEMIRLAVTGSKRNGKHCGLCGQAPSDYPEMAQFLVEIGIDSMSLNPDTVLKTTQLVSKTEK